MTYFLLALLIRGERIFSHKTFLVRVIKKRSFKPLSHLRCEFEIPLAITYLPTDR